MSDSQKPKQVSIPSWQKAEVATGESERSSHDDNDNETHTSQAKIVGKVQIETPGNHDQDEVAAKPQSVDGAEAEVPSQVRMFLADASVKTAPLEKKRAFLKTKGVSEDIINRALPGTPMVSQAQQKPGFDVAEFEQSLRPPVTEPSQNRSSAPPVVTYPEFLVQPQKPPPLVTINGLVDTAYVAGGLGTIIYGLSRYVVAPMTANMTEARHEFAEHANVHIVKFNEKLSDIVTVVPSKAKSKIDSDPSEDDESVASDPTELFHRDMGTQTVPEPAGRGDTDSSASETPGSAKTVLDKQEDRLKIMTSHLEELLSGVNSKGGSNLQLQEQVTGCRDLLESLLYLPPAQIENGVWQTAPQHDKKKDDAIAAFKAEIRGVKGVLLSAKRFPASGRAPTARVGG